MTRALSPPVRRVLLAVTAVGLLASVYIHSNAGFYDHDEIGHYISLESMTRTMWFQPWQRAGFKVLYLPLSHLSLGQVRLVNMLLIAGCALLLYRVAGAFGALVFLTLPYVHEIGARFYSEIPAMALVALAIVLLRERKTTAFALGLSFAVLVRFETAVLLVPAAYALRAERGRIPLLVVFPVAFYLVSVGVSGQWSYLFERYALYAREHTAHGDDPFHYVWAMLRMGGVWPLVAAPAFVAGLRRGDETQRFMALAAAALLAVYSVSYWTTSAFGIARHAILFAPMVAAFAAATRFRYRAVLAVVAAVFVLLLPLKHPGIEEQTLDPACDAIRELAYSTLYVEHPYVNLRLGLPLHSDTVTTLEFRGHAQPGDVMLWENHYASRLAAYDDVVTEWMPIWQAFRGGFEVYLLRKL